MKEQIIHEDFDDAPTGVVGNLHATLADKLCRWSCWAAGDGVKAWASGSFKPTPKQHVEADALSILADTKATLLARVRAALAL